MSEEVESIFDISDLIKTNNRLCATILKFEMNIRKTAESKITKGYLDARSVLIEKHWTGFEINRSKIMDELDPEEEKTAVYCTSDTYGRVEEAYLNIVTFINDKMNELFSPVSLANSSPINVSNQQSRFESHHTNDHYS